MNKEQVRVLMKVFFYERLKKKSDSDNSSSIRSKSRRIKNNWDPMLHEEDGRDSLEEVAFELKLE